MSRYRSLMLASQFLLLPPLRLYPLADVDPANFTKGMVFKAIFSSTRRATGGEEETSIRPARRVVDAGCRWVSHISPPSKMVANPRKIDIYRERERKKHQQFDGNGHRGNGWKWTWIAGRICNTDERSSTANTPDGRSARSTLRWCRWKSFQWCWTARSRHGMFGDRAHPRNWEPMTQSNRSSMRSDVRKYSLDDMTGPFAANAKKSKKVTPPSDTRSKVGAAFSPCYRSWARWSVAPCW